MANTVSGKYRNDTGPLTTSYSRFDAYSIENSIRDELMDKEVDVMMVEGQKQTITKGSNIISEKYLAGGEGFSMGGEYGDGEVLVVIQSSDGTDVVAYVVKTREELGDDYYSYRYAFMGEMTDAIWNTMQGWFQPPQLTTTITSGVITIASNKGDAIKVDSTTHYMIYDADYYAEVTNTTTEYSTLQTNGWLAAGTYTLSDTTVWDGVVSSIKTKGIANATITHDTVNGEITIANGNYSITIADKNLGATTVYNNGDTLAEANMGNMYQWGNNYGFPSTGTISNTSSTQVDASGYGPGNYYSSNTFITLSNRDLSLNYNLWGGITDTEVARKGPCNNGYHIPSRAEWIELGKFFSIIRPNAHSPVDISSEFHIPFAGLRRLDSSATIDGQGNYGDYWTSSGIGNQEYFRAWSPFISSDTFYTAQELSCGYGLSIRPFKNTVNANINPGFDEEDI